MSHREKLLDYEFVLLFCKLICVFISSIFFRFLEWSYGLSFFFNLPLPRANSVAGGRCNQACH
jgi:hypothetical protein